MKQLLYIGLLLGFFACSTAEQATDQETDRTEQEATEEQETDEQDDQDLAEMADAEDFDRPFRDVEAPFGYGSRTVYSLFQDEFRNEQWDMALTYNRYLISEHPKTMEGVDSYRGDRQFDRMIDIYTGIAQEQEDDELKEAYLDSALYMYEWVFNIFDADEIDEYRWLMNRGRYYQEHSDDIEDGMQHAYADYERLFEMDVERTTESGDGYYVQIMLQNLKNQGEHEKVIEWIERAEPYAGDSLKEEFAELRDEIFSEPEDRVNWLLTVLEDDPENVDVMEEIYELYDELGESDKKWEMARDIYQLDPSFDNVMRMARLHGDEGQFEEANEYLIESLELTNNAERRKETTMRLSQNYLNMREFEDAFEFAERAADAVSDSGEPYVQKADIIAQTVSTCAGGDMGRRDRAVYWLVLDYLDRAEEIDSGVERSVRNRYSNYENSMPSSEDKHFMGWGTGDSFTVDGEIRDCYAWINEQTTVR